MKVLIVEDQKNQFEFLRNTLLKDNDSLEIDRIVTEHSFESEFENIASHPPDIIIMDVMFRWEDTERNKSTMSDEVKKQGKYRAGVRCIRVLSEDKRTKNIPIIIYSILDKSDLQKEIEQFSQVKYLFKDFTEERILKMIHSIKEKSS